MIVAANGPLTLLNKKSKKNLAKYIHNTKKIVSKKKKRKIDGKSFLFDTNYVQISSKNPFCT